MLSFGLPRWSALLLTLVVAGTLGGCFRPLYGDQAAGGVPGVADKLRSVEVDPVKTPLDRNLPRVGGEARNDLRFMFTGGGEPNTTEYHLIINLSGAFSTVATDVNSGRADKQFYILNASYSLMGISNSKAILSGTAYANVSYDIPGMQQRFAGSRALRDAENRAAMVIAESIRTRLASYFASGVP